MEFLAEHPGVCTGLLSTLGAVGHLDEALHANEIYVARPVRDAVQAAFPGGHEPFGDDLDDTVNGLLGAILMIVTGRSMTGRELRAVDAAAVADRLLALAAVPETGPEPDVSTVSCDRRSQRMMEAMDEFGSVVRAGWHSGWPRRLPEPDGPSPR